MKFQSTALKDILSILVFCNIVLLFSGLAVKSLGLGVLHLLLG